MTKAGKLSTFLNRVTETPKGLIGCDHKGLPAIHICSAPWAF